MNVPLPPNEAERLETLHDYAILDTAPEAAFERITRLAARLFNVPIAFVSLVDADRQWFKSCYGLDAQQMGREVAFCAYAILDSEVMVVPDTTLDPRFKDNPLVTGDPRIRFYTGAPLHSPEGQNLGTLAVLDTTPRHFNAQDMATLADLAAQVMDGIRLRQVGLALRDENLERRRAAHALAERDRLAHLSADVGFALTRSDTLQEMLQRCAEALVRHLDAAFARIWTLNAAGNALELQASAGLYTRLDGAHSRVPVGQFKIGLIAQERQPHLTNEVIGDPCIHDQEWARGEGMVAFAGYPLIVEERVVGVMAIFARQPLADDVLQTMAAVADTIAVGIERKEAEAKLHESEARFEAFMNNSPATAFMKDEAGRYVYINEPYERLFNVRKDALLGKTDFDCFPPELARQLRANDEAALAAGQMVEVEEIVPIASGETRFWLVFKFPVADQAGRRFVGSVAFDITARKQAEEALQESETRFRAVIEAIPQHVWTAQPDGALDYVNQRVLDYFERTSEATVGSGWHDMVHPDDLPECIERWNRSLTTGEPYEVEFRLRRSGDGTYHPHIGRALPLRDPEGKITKWFGSNTDITDRKHAEEALKAAKEEAERANRAKSEFLSRMSHELRTPMNAILGFGQLLEMDDLTTQQIQNVEFILQGGRHLLRLINEVLEISRIEAGRMAVSLEPVRLLAVLQEAWDLVRPLAAQRGVQADGAWEQSCDRSVLADPQRLKQVVLNLLSNAIKYNREGGTVTLICRESTRQEARGRAPQVAERRQAEGGRRQGDSEPEAGDRRQVAGGIKREIAGADLSSLPSGNHLLPTLRLEITDTGPGITAENLEKLFTPFERLGAENSGIEGTGIGLALSQRLMELMGGDIGVESVAGLGSTFWIELPLAEGSSVTCHVPGDDPHVTLDTRHLTPIATVLYIEDNLSNLRLVEGILLRQPHIKLLAAMQGGLGLELAREHQPALILLDLNLPDIMGDEVLRRLRADAATQHIPVIMLSADATPRQIARLLEAGANDYLTKPLDVKRFMTVLDENLAGEGESA